MLHAKYDCNGYEALQSFLAAKACACNPAFILIHLFICFLFFIFIIRFTCYLITDDTRFSDNPIQFLWSGIYIHTFITLTNCGPNMLTYTLKCFFKRIFFFFGNGWYIAGCWLFYILILIYTREYIHIIHNS